MMTYEDYAMACNAISEKIRASRREEAAKCVAIDMERSEQNHIDFEQMVERKRMRTMHCKEKCDAIRLEYAEQRRQLHLEQVRLNEQWRKERSSITPSCTSMEESSLRKEVRND